MGRRSELIASKPRVGPVPKGPHEFKHDIIIPSAGKTDTEAGMNGNRLPEQFWTQIKYGVIHGPVTMKVYLIEHITVELIHPVARQSIEAKPYLTVVAHESLDMAA